MSELVYDPGCRQCGSDNVEVLQSEHRGGIVGVACRNCGYRNDNPDIRSVTHAE